MKPPSSESAYTRKPELPLFASSAPVSGETGQQGELVGHKPTAPIVPVSREAVSDDGKERNPSGEETGCQVRFLGAHNKVVGQSHAEQAPTRRGMPETSYKAAASVSLVNLGRTKERIMNVLRSFGPCTDEQISYAFEAMFGKGQVSPSGLRTRRSWLVDHGLVCDSGQRAKTQSGRESIVWRIA